MSGVFWGDPREYGEQDRDDGRPRVYDEPDRDDHDPRDGLMHDLDLPPGEERELVVNRDRVYELNGEDGRTLAAVGVFRVVPAQDLDLDHDTLDHLRDEGLVENVDLGDDERGVVLTKDGRDLLRSHILECDETRQSFYAGVGRPREIDHDSHLYATYRQEEARLRDEHGNLEIGRVVLDAPRGALDPAESERQRGFGDVLSRAAGAGRTHRRPDRSLHRKGVPATGNREDDGLLSSLATAGRHGAVEVVIDEPS